MAKLLLEMRDIIKEFPGVRALDHVNLEVEEGEIHALVGENGAGKSTLMNVLSGIYPFGTYEGDIVYDGQTCKFGKIRDSEEKGIVIIHQELALVPYLTIGENMFLGNEQGKTARIDWDATYDKADKYLKMVGLQESARTQIKDIGVGKQQLVEIAKALAKNVRLLILDEPTASLNETDSQKLLDLLLQFKAQGMTCIIISHKLSEVSYVADKITIIRDGATIETLVKGVDDLHEERIIKGMVGRELTDRFPKRESHIGEVAMQVRDWSVEHPTYAGQMVCRNVNLDVRRGEIVGVSGLMGAGRTELAMSIFGKSYGVNITGKLLLGGREVHLRSVNDAIEHKLAYVTEDRKGNGLILSNPIRVNTTLARMKRISRHGVLDKDMEIKYADEYKEMLHTKCSGIEQDVGNLSGGNQQKVLLAKWMFAEPDVLILDEPTRGIDVGAKYEIYCIMNELVAQGKAVLMISSEMPELLGMCDRIYVMNEGAVVGELTREEASQESIMSCILKSSAGKGEVAV
ncbi:xylose ABC transporter ATP-binding protein [Oscillospiraceae bacterium]|nr:xylose ABC transporter ATP-binding protein [Oscillospiraceae bacterium]BDF74520.1 xylose ABC transporter ATP-binding protein [Oscillospiraceae bacterium]